MTSGVLGGRRTIKQSSDPPIEVTQLVHLKPIGQSAKQEVAGQVRGWLLSKHGPPMGPKRAEVEASQARDLLVEGVSVRQGRTDLDARHVTLGVRLRFDSTLDEGHVTLGVGWGDTVADARHVILACWNNVIPHLCPELSAAQRTALEYPEKIPLAVVNVGVRNWRAVAASGFGEVYTPGGFINRAGLDFPVSMGGYKYTADPDQPAILDCWHAAAMRDTTLEPRERLRLGRHRMLAMSFADYEAEVRAQLTAMWGAHGFDPDRDIAAITVNRWPHGYSWEYTDRWDAPEWSRGAGRT